MLIVRATSILQIGLLLISSAVVGANSHGQEPQADTPEQYAAKNADFKKVMYRPVSFDLDETTLEEAAKVLSAMTDLKISVDSKVGTNSRECRINFNVHDMKLHYALTWIARLTETQGEIHNNGIYVLRAYIDNIATNGLDAPNPYANEAKNEITGIERQLLTRTVSLDLKDEPLQKVMAVLSKEGRISILLDPKAKAYREKSTITLKAKNMGLKEALKSVMKLANLEYRIIDQAFFVLLPEDNAVK